MLNFAPKNAFMIYFNFDNTPAKGNRLSFLNMSFKRQLSLSFNEILRNKGKPFFQGFLIKTTNFATLSISTSLL
jgi:hypothetical protein